MDFSAKEDETRLPPCQQGEGADKCSKRPACGVDAVARESYGTGSTNGCYRCHPVDLLHWKPLGPRRQQRSETAMIAACSANRNTSLILKIAVADVAPPRAFRVPQPDIQASRFKSQVNSAKLLGRTGCQYYNTNPRFQRRLGVCRWRGETSGFLIWSATRGAVSRAIRAALVAN